MTRAVPPSPSIVRPLSRIPVILACLSFLILLPACEDEVDRGQLEEFPGSYEYSAFSLEGPAVTLSGTLEISGLQATRGTATVGLDVQGQWAGSTLRVESAPGTIAFLEMDGSIFIQDEGSALIGPEGGTPAAFVMTHSGRLEDGEIRGTFTLQMDGLGRTSGEFSATR